MGDGMRIEWDVPTTMDDGLTLRADVFRPVGAGRSPGTRGPAHQPPARIWRRRTQALKASTTATRTSIAAMMLQACGSCSSESS